VSGEVHFRFVSWNLQWSSSKEQQQGQLQLIRDLKPDLLAVQEVKDTTLRPLAEHFDWKVFALGENPDDRYWTTRMGTAVLGGPRATLVGQELIAPTWFGLEDRWRWKANRFARRATWARVLLEGTEHVVRVGSLHASPAAGDIGHHKPWFHAGVGRWLEHLNEPWIFGIDANAPGVDPPDPDRIGWGWPQTETWPGEDQLLGARARHRGRDLLRAWLAQHPEELTRIAQERPDGPLAISYELGSGPVRYDHCWATPEIRVDHIDYLTDALEFSDHAPIVCDVALRTPTDAPEGLVADATTATMTQPPAKPEVPVPPGSQPSRTSDPDHEVEGWISRVLADLRSEVVDVRGEPTERHRGQFKRGWRHAAAGGTYTQRVLQELTWNNLGYRLAVDAGASPTEDGEGVDEIFDVAANGFEDGSLRLPR
jgi:endonuclease/exonuclease/phosphatase family metal-dependent hydrolase